MLPESLGILLHPEFDPSHKVEICVWNAKLNP